jgi:hypothetical protein
MVRSGYTTCWILFHMKKSGVELETEENEASAWLDGIPFLMSRDAAWDHARLQGPTRSIFQPLTTGRCSRLSPALAVGHLKLTVG